jgi:hypothetical protein
VVRRRTDEGEWDIVRASRLVPTASSGQQAIIFNNIRGDDWMFGVAACAGDVCSPVSSGVPAGAFEPVGK